LESRGILTDKVILEMEYQKSHGHGTSQRPDIILHVPVEISGGSVRDNNFAVWALKHSGSGTAAEEDFNKLDEICVRLNYPLLIFVNIASAQTHLDRYQGPHRERIHAFAVPSLTGTEIQHAFFENGTMKVERYPLT
jgi:hypothetical protein